MILYISPELCIVMEKLTKRCMQCFADSIARAISLEVAKGK